MRRLLVVGLCSIVVAACAGTGSRRSDTVTVFGPYRGVEADRFVASLAAFTDRTGIEVRYTGSADFVTDLAERVEAGGSPPDVAIVPQPGLVRRLVDRGAVVALDVATSAVVDDNYGRATAALGEVDGVRYGVPFRISAKSLVWYRPDVFAANGWLVPRTLDDLDRLAATIAASTGAGDGPAPWCLALQSGSATGWPATDWVEDLLVRRAGPAAAEAWADGTLGFSSDEVRAAFDEFERLVLAPGRLSGRRSDAVERPTTAVLDGLLGPDPACAMAKQADFAASWLPDGTSVGADADVDWFVLPGATADDPPPLSVGGDLAVGFRRDAVVDALLAHLAGPDGGSSWAAAGGFVTPRTSFDPAAYPDDSTRALAELVLASEAIVFDVSDQMPADVGTSPFWSMAARWVAGSVTLDELAADLDARRRPAAGPRVTVPGS
jgi:alpha-glucoside transport system substrate-binding protein